MAKIRNKSARNAEVMICGENVKFDNDGIGEIKDENLDYALSIPGYEVKGKVKAPEKTEPAEKIEKESKKSTEKSASEKK